MVVPSTQRILCTGFSLIWYFTPPIEQPVTKRCFIIVKMPFRFNDPNRPSYDAGFYEQPPWPFAVTIHAVFARAGV